VICPACGRENPPDSTFCEQCGGTLERACPSCGAACSPTARFCRKCRASLSGDRAAAPNPRSYTPKHLADKILTSRNALEGERKQVTVVFADLKGSMDLSESIDPEEWHRIMERFFQILTDGVHRFEGTVNQYTGDGIMALFGAPIAHEDHAARACYAALALQDDLRPYAAELRQQKGISFSVRMGLNSGEVVVGTIGDNLRMDYTALGHTASLAARMEQIAESGKAYLTEHTAKLVEGLLKLQDLGKLAVKGVKDPVGVYELQGIGRLRTKLEVSRVRGFSRFVGRAHEMSSLEAALNRSLEGSGQVVGIVADPGVGKSRLCSEFLERCRARDLPIYQAHAVSHGKSIPLLPILQMFRNFFGITDQDTNQQAREKIAGRLILLNEDPLEGIPLVFEFLGVPDPERAAPQLDPQGKQRRLFSLVKRVMHARSKREPAVLMLEDLHWIDSSSEAFLEALVDGTAGTRTLFLVNFRPEYHSRWMQKSYYQQLPLTPLSSAAVAELLKDLLGADPTVSDFGDRINQRTGGNPFFIEEVVQSLLETGVLSGTRGNYRLIGSPDAVAIPPTVHAVLASRIDRLGDREKRLIQTASVIGKTFGEAILKRVAELPEIELQGALSSLEQAEFVYEQSLYPETEYVFKHPLTQEVAYRSQLAERRRMTHAAIACAIEGLYPDKLDEQAALVAHHFESAGESLDAARWYQRAAEWASLRDPVAAVLSWRNVKDQLETVPESGETVALGIASRAQMLTYGWRLGAVEEEAARLFAEGKALAERIDDRRSLVLLHLGYGITVGTAGADLERYRTFALEAWRLAEALDDEGLKLAILTQLIHSHATAGKFRESAAFVERGRTEAPVDPQFGTLSTGFSPYIFFRAYQARLVMYLASLDQAEAGLLETLKLTADHHSADILCAVHAFLSDVACMKGDGGAALTEASRGLEAAEKLGSAYWMVWSSARMGRAHLVAEQWTESIQQLEQTLEFARNRRAGRDEEARFVVDLAEAYLGRGDLAVAEVKAADALSMARHQGARFSEALAHLTIARTAMRKRSIETQDEASANVAQAREIIEETGAKTYEPFVRVELARLARAKGDDVVCEREFREAHRLFTEIGAPIRAAEVARELDS
jgi:class 3 adenylate cyclase